jgi:hypothetical protein
MSNRQEHSDAPIFTATKVGVNVQFSRDLHPGTDTYLVIEAPGLLVLFPKDRGGSEPLDTLPQIEPLGGSDHDAVLRNAFDALGSRVTASAWSTSSKPKIELVAGFKALQVDEGT